MPRLYATDSDLLAEVKAHILLGQWEVVEALVDHCLPYNLLDGAGYNLPLSTSVPPTSSVAFFSIRDILTSVALQPHKNSYCLVQNLNSPEQLAYLAARYLKNKHVLKDASFRCMLRNLPQLAEDVRYSLLESFTKGEPPEQQVIYGLRQCCLLSGTPLSLYFVLDWLQLSNVVLESVLQICVRVQQTDCSWVTDPLLEKVEELVSFLPSKPNVIDGLTRSVANRLLEVLWPSSKDRLMSMAISCSNHLFRAALLETLSAQECVFSRAKAQGKHFMELHLESITKALVAKEELPENFLGVNLKPLALLFAWDHLASEARSKYVDDFEALYPSDSFIQRLAGVLRECCLLTSMTGIPWHDIITLRHTQSFLRVVYTTGVLQKKVNEPLLMHIVKHEFQAQTLRACLALRRAFNALFYAILISMRRFDRSTAFAPRVEGDVVLENTVDLVNYIDKHGPDVSFDALVTPELQVFDKLLSEVTDGELKVELLENAFSLLFVTHRELKDETVELDEKVALNVENHFERLEHDKPIKNRRRPLVHAFGFLASEQFIRALLPTLLDRIRSTKLKLYDDKRLLARLERLLQHAINATWRLELVEHKLNLNLDCVRDVNDEVNECLLKNRRRNMRRKKKSRAALHIDSLASQASVVELMLSTLDALLRHCLWKGDYDRARQVFKVANVEALDLVDKDELEFCLGLPYLERELIKLQACCEPALSAVFAAVDSFLQLQLLSANIPHQEMCRFYLNLGFTPKLRLSVAHRLFVYAGELASQDDGGCNALQTVNGVTAILGLLCEKLVDNEDSLSLYDVLNVPSCFKTDPVRLREGRIFWKVLKVTTKKFLAYLNYSDNNASNNKMDSLHSVFLRLSKMTGSGIRKYHVSLDSFNFDYIRALYAHARQVYKALEEKQQNIRTEQCTEGVVAASVSNVKNCTGYFRVLEECSPSMTLLKLILQDHVPPARLEQFAVKMKLNITQCVSKELLPNLYLRSTNGTVEQCEQSFHVRVLNSNFRSPYDALSALKGVNDSQTSLKGLSARDPMFVARKLLTQLIDILKEKNLSKSKFILERYENLHETVTSVEYERWCESTRELAYVDLMKLKSEDRLPFFFNVLHCLVLHRLLYCCQRSSFSLVYGLQAQIEDALYAYEIGSLGAVTLLQMKYSILFNGHSLPPLAKPLVSLAKLSMQATSASPSTLHTLLPSPNIFSVFSLVQGFDGDPPLQVIESEKQLKDGFARALHRINVDVQSNKMYVPWQLKEIVQGNFFKTSERELLRLTVNKMGGRGFSFYFVEPQSFFLNFCTTPTFSDLCRRPHSDNLQIPGPVVSYIEEQCAPIGFMVNAAQTTVESELQEVSTLVAKRFSYSDEGVPVLAGLQRLLAFLPNATYTALTGDICDDIWHLIATLDCENDSLERILASIDVCEALSGGRIIASKLYFTRKLVLENLARQSFRFVLRMDTSAAKITGFIKNYIFWPDKDVDVAARVLKSLVEKHNSCFEHLDNEMERIIVCRCIGRVLHMDWRLVQNNIPWVVEKLESDLQLGLVHKLLATGLVDTARKPFINDSKFWDFVSELNTCYYFSLNRDSAFITGLCAIDRINDCEQRLSFCCKVLNRLQASQGKLCLLRYLMFKYSSDKVLVRRFRTRALGVEALLAIPALQLGEYSHLEEWPELLVENMIMNIKLDSVKSFLDRSKFASQKFRLKVDDLCELYAKRALELAHMPSRVGKDSPLRCSQTTSPRATCQFEMPVKAPSFGQWVKDENVSKCMSCSSKFSIFVRKHHCRRCGRVICSGCSSKGKLIVEGYGLMPVRVCNYCFLQVVELDIDEATEALEGIEFDGPANELRPNLLVETTWRLKKPTTKDNTEYNENTRRMFCYERAPSVSLCLSILDRHSSAEKAASFTLSLCDRLVALLFFPSEIDYGLVIAMLQALLTKARTNLREANDPGFHNLCELYFKMLDLLKILVKNNCQMFIPRELLACREPNSAYLAIKQQELRDCLIHDERFQLAIDVSLKCGLSVDFVYIAWGLALLRAGNWCAARDKLCLGLKRPDDLSDERTESCFLKDVLNALEKSTCAGESRALVVYSALAALKNIKLYGVQRSDLNAASRQAIRVECWFYLEKFACYSTAVSFCVKEGQYKTALSYCINNGCGGEVFVSEIFLPLFRSNRLELLLAEINGYENFSCFTTYLAAVCSYLEENGFIHTLQRLQVFMEDWAHAALTSIQIFEAEAYQNFPLDYTAPARLRYLSDAKKYSELYLKCSLGEHYNEAKWHNISQNETMTVKEASRLLLIISLQLDVLRFFARREEMRDNGLTMLPLSTNKTPANLVNVAQKCESQVVKTTPSLRDSSKKLPSLFSASSDDKQALAAMILINGSSVEEGFGLCLRVVAECELNGTEVLCKALRHLAEPANGEIQLDRIQKLVYCVHQSGYDSRQYDVDEAVIQTIISILTEKVMHDEKELDTIVESLLRVIKDDKKKVRAYTESRRLRSAYILAVRLGEINAVRQIREKAVQFHQPAIFKLCDKWLQNKGPK